MKTYAATDVVAHLSTDSRANAVFLCCLEAMPDQYVLKVTCRDGSPIYAGSRPDLPFKNLTFSAGDEASYSALIGDFRDNFSPGDEIYSLLPEKFGKVLERVVPITSRELETQLFRGPSAPPPETETARTLENRGFNFRVLKPDDLPVVQRLFEESETFVAFSEGSFIRGLFHGAFKEGLLVAVAGTHTLGSAHCEVGNVVTEKQHRRLGLAKACIELLVNELHSRGLAMFLFSWRRDFLVALYQSLGFANPIPFELLKWKYPDKGD